MRKKSMPLRIGSVSGNVQKNSVQSLWLLLLLRHFTRENNQKETMRGDSDGSNPQVDRTGATSSVKNRDPIGQERKKRGSLFPTKVISHQTFTTLMRQTTSRRSTTSSALQRETNDKLDTQNPKEQGE
jgi:hypothetical protein